MMRRTMQNAMQRFIQKLPQGRGLPIVFWLLGLLLCGIVIGRSQFTTDLSAFMPRNPTPEQQLLMNQLRATASSTRSRSSGARPWLSSRLKRSLSSMPTIRRWPR